MGLPFSLLDFGILAAIMASPELWLEVLSITKALFDATKSGIDVIKSYRKHRAEPATISESRRVSKAFSTFSDTELRAILSRLEQCRDRFIAQGGGGDRSRCVCSVLNEVKDGNGGRLPVIDDWENIYRQLGCDRTS